MCSQGGGLYNGSSVTLNNTIVADSPSGGDVAGASLLGSHNLMEDGSGRLADTLTGDPKLGPLADNGGPTLTMALLPGSPAIDAGDSGLGHQPAVPRSAIHRPARLPAHDSQIKGKTASLRDGAP